jgi:hypothetical protein
MGGVSKMPFYLGVTEPAPFGRNLNVLDKRVGRISELAGYASWPDMRVGRKCELASPHLFQHFQGKYNN